MQIRSTKVFYFEKYFENTILFCIFKILFRSILHITAYSTRSLVSMNSGRQCSVLVFICICSLHLLLLLHNLRTCLTCITVLSALNDLDVVRYIIDVKIDQFTRSALTYSLTDSLQCRLIQWARGPQASRGPQTADA